MKIFKKWWFWVLVVIVVIAATNMGGNDTTTPTSAPAGQKTETKKDEPKLAKIGQDKKVGDLVFKVQSIKEEKMIGNSTLNIKPQGKFLVVELNITNNGKEKVDIIQDFFKIIEADGTEYSPSTEAWGYVEQEKTY
ncbi:DUF4352 domain-containing protein [Tepidibacillus marianensis]|uniref:DUF4352 domain-containing protein n=1 Tax=Tepidibacillus marianensis TaxID=3131995 RepID=UPI0030D3D25F